MLEILKNRFQGNMNLHPELQWADVENRLREKPDVMEVLRKMEKSGGEPDTMEKNNKKANEVQVDEILSWASRFDDASYEAKHLVIAQLVDRIEIRKNDGYDITIHWRMTAEQFLGRKTEASA